jgi:hypothetical protein
MIDATTTVGPKVKFDSGVAGQSPSITVPPEHCHLFESHDPSRHPGCILRLVQSAERLDRVERDLIRQISLNFPIDASTKRLLTELRVTTSRLRGQIAEIERIDNSASKETELAIPSD